MNWKQLKTEQEQAVVAAIRGLINATEETQIMAEVSENGCVVTMPQSPFSMVQFVWECDTPEDLVCTTMSGAIQNDPPSLTITPSSVTLSALAAIRATIAGICGSTEDGTKDGDGDECEQDNPTDGSAANA